MGEAVSKITDDSEKNAALADLGVASAMVGEALKDTARLLKVRAETNTNIGSIFNRQSPLVAIVEALNRLGEPSKDRTLLSEAVTTAEMILGEKSKDAKVQALSMIAESFARFGDKEKARALLLEAVKVAEQSVNTTLRNNGLRALARSVIKIAESPDDRILYDKLFSLYERIKNEDERQILFDSILTSNLVIADIGKMRSLALRYDNEARRSTALAHILMASSHHPELIERTKKSDEEYQ
jgi:tetratricopeptide (TPR) repeat protein